MVKMTLYFSALVSAALALGATETTPAAEKRLKCTVGIAARAMIKELHGDKGATLYDKMGMLLRGINPQHEICYRKKTQELIVLNSQKTPDVHFHALAAVLSDKNELSPSLSDKLPSGEHVLTLKISKSLNTEHRLPAPNIFRSHIWLKGCMNADGTSSIVHVYHEHPEDGC